MHFNKIPATIKVLSGLTLAVCILTRCIDKHNEKVLAEKPNEQVFAGSGSCEGCHRDIYLKHQKTAHFLTSQLAADSTILGSFEPGKNSFAFNASDVVVMENRRDKFYQVQYNDGKEDKVRAFDVVVGSGTMGQSFLNWRNHGLFQLPITYFTAANQWSNSPGFPDKPVFNRPITSRCLECHSTFAEVTSKPNIEPETFAETNMILGVDCEKCHGPAAGHVRYQTNNPADTAAKFIINPGKLSRIQNMELCGLCHGGRLQKISPSFTFLPGDKLAAHFKIDTTTPDPKNIDVHGNQYALLRASKCYRLSETLTCNSCHNTHENERGQTALFSQRCITCHNQKHNGVCPLSKTLGKAINTNCIDCHIPVKPSKAIAVFLPGSNTATAALIRSHLVGIYPQESKEIEKMMRVKRK